MQTSRQGYIIGQNGPARWTSLIPRLAADFSGAIDMADITRAIIAGAASTLQVDPAQWVLDFTRAAGGKLSQILRPELVGSQIWWLLDGAPSGVAGVTTNTLRTTLFTLEDASVDPSLAGILDPIKPWNKPRHGAKA